MRHRTWPIQDENQTMILTIRKNTYFLKEILIELVSVKIGCIKNTCACSWCTSIWICCFLTLKLFYQIVDLFLCSPLKLNEWTIRHLKDIKVKVTITIVVIVQVFVDFFILGNDLINIYLRNLNINIFTTIFPHKIFDVLTKCFRSLNLNIIIFTLLFSGDWLRLSFLRLTTFSLINVARNIALVWHRGHLLLGFLLLLLTILVENFSSKEDIIKVLTSTNHADDCHLFLSEREV